MNITSFSKLSSGILLHAMDVKQNWTCMDLHMYGRVWTQKVYGICGHAHDYNHYCGCMLLYITLQPLLTHNLPVYEVSAVVWCEFIFRPRWYIIACEMGWKSKDECMGMYVWIYNMDGEQCEHQKCVFNVECVTMSSTIIICAYRILSKIADTLIVWTPQLWIFHLSN